MSAYYNAPINSYSIPRMYITLLHRIKTSPKFPDISPSINSSVFANYCESRKWTEALILTKMSKVYLDVHVGVNGHQDTLILHSPLQLYNHGLSSELPEEWLRIDNTLQADKERWERRKPTMKLGGKKNRNRSRTLLLPTWWRRRNSFYRRGKKYQERYRDEPSWKNKSPIPQSPTLFQSPIFVAQHDFLFFSSLFVSSLWPVVLSFFVFFISRLLLFNIYFF